MEQNNNNLESTEIMQEAVAFTPEMVDDPTDDDKFDHDYECGDSDWSDPLEDDRGEELDFSMHHSTFGGE